MTPAFWDKDQLLIRAQLRCLAEQTFKDFDVWLIDPHYQKRKGIVPELAEIYGLSLIHVPWVPNTAVAKWLDYSIVNAVYCYSESPLVARYFCYRFVRPGFAESIMAVPSGVNVDFYSLNIGPDLRETYDGAAHVRHKKVWDFDGDRVHWDEVPPESGMRAVGFAPERSLACWPPQYDMDAGVGPFPLDASGNIMVWRENWLDLNGTNEVFTNREHWEDMDWDVRANRAGQTAVRRTHLMYRLHHEYGRYSGRSTIEFDVPLRRPCGRCLERDDAWLARMRESGTLLEAYRERARLGEIALHEEEMVWSCTSCGLTGPLYNASANEYLTKGYESGRVRAPVMRELMLGRNLRILSEDMDRCASLSGKIGIFNDSWTNPRYYDAA